MFDVDEELAKGPRAFLKTVAEGKGINLLRLKQIMAANPKRKSAPRSAPGSGAQDGGLTGGAACIDPTGRRSRRPLADRTTCDEPPLRSELFSVVVVAPSKARRLLPGESPGRVRASGPPVSSVGSAAEWRRPRTKMQAKRTQNILWAVGEIALPEVLVQLRESKPADGDGVNVLEANIYADTWGGRARGCPPESSGRGMQEERRQRARDAPKAPPRGEIRRRPAVSTRSRRRSTSLIWSATSRGWRSA